MYPFPLKTICTTNVNFRFCNPTAHGGVATKPCQISLLGYLDGHTLSASTTTDWLIVSLMIRTVSLTTYPTSIHLFPHPSKEFGYPTRHGP
jgi:hypothetical protein